MRDPLAWLFGLIIILGAVLNAALAEGQDHPATEDEIAILRLCASEASLRVSDDCRVIASIVRYQSGRRHLSPARYVERYHHRHTRSPSRPESVPWETRGRPALLRLLDVIRDDDGHGCDVMPVTWGGPRVDRARLARMLASGWRRAACGTTANVYLARGRR